MAIFRLIMPPESMIESDFENGLLLSWSKETGFYPQRFHQNQHLPRVGDGDLPMGQVGEEGDGGMGRGETGLH
jgi:hypothetical protein